MGLPIGTGGVNRRPFYIRTLKTEQETATPPLCRWPQRASAAAAGVSPDHLKDAPQGAVNDEQGLPALLQFQFLCLTQRLWSESRFQ